MPQVNREQVAGIKGGREKEREREGQREIEIKREKERKRENVDLNNAL